MSTPPAPTPSAPRTSTSTSSSSSPSLLPIPPVLRRLFDAFPLLTYPPAALPARSPDLTSSPLPRLYVFAAPDSEGRDAPSFNPSCLKWQAYLKFCGVEYTNVPSSNHASPSGQLPFLLPAASAGGSAGAVGKALPARQLLSWAGPQSGCDLQAPEVAAVMELVDSRVRDAWLYALHLSPLHFPLAQSLYCHTAVPLVNALLSRRMRSSAAAELARTRSGVLTADEVYADADAAWAALEEILGGDEWFFGAQAPGLVDAAVFAYTHLVLGVRWDGAEAGVVTRLRACKALVGHEKRVRAVCGW